MAGGESGHALVMGHPSQNPGCTEPRSTRTDYGDCSLVRDAVTIGRNAERHGNKKATGCHDWYEPLRQRPHVKS